MSLSQTNLWALQTSLLGLRSAVVTGQAEAVSSGLTHLARLAEPIPPSSAVLADLQRITAAQTPLTVGDLDQVLERLRFTLSTPDGIGPLPWNGEIKGFLQRVWPGEIAFPMRRIQDVPEFLLRAHKVMRHVHRAELLDNIRKQLLTLEDQALAAELAAELEPSGSLAGIFSRGGDRVSHVALRQLVAFAGRATGCIAPSSDPPSPPALRGLRVPARRSEPLADAAAVAETVASCLESIAAFETDLATLTDIAEKTLQQLRSAALQLKNAVEHLERTVAQDLPALNEDVLRLLEELPEETVEGAMTATERLPSLAEEAQLALMVLEETLQAREAEEDELRERGRITERLDEALEDIERTAQDLIPLLAKAGEAADGAERLTASMDLTAGRFALAYPEISETLARLRAARTGLHALLTRERDFLDSVPKERREGAIADRIEAYESRADGLRELVDTYESRLAERISRLEERETTLPLSPPAPVPSPPAFVSRRFQARPETPREILEILANVDPRQHRLVNQLPEIALIAPDEEVYSSLLTVLNLRRRYGTRGTYVAYLEDGKFQDGYAPNFVPRSSQGDSNEIVRFVGHDGLERSLPSSEFFLAVTLDRVNPPRMELELRSAGATYHQYKIKYYTAVLRIDPSLTDQYTSHFELHHLGAPSPLFPTIRFQFLSAHFLNEDIRRLLMGRLSAKTTDVDIAHRLESAGDKAQILKVSLEALAQRNRTVLSDGEMNSFLYLYGFEDLLSRHSDDEREKMKEEIFGRPIEELAPDLRYAGGVRGPLESWTRREGVIGTRDARERFRHAVVLSGPEGSRLLLDRAGARAAERFFKTRVAEGTIHDALGERVPVTTGGRGYRFASPQDCSGTWYAALIRRLELLAARPTPVSDFVFQALAAQDFRETDGLLSELLGVLMEDPDDADVTCETILDRAALWIMHNADRFAPMRTLRDLSKQWKRPHGPASRRSS